MPFQSDVAFLLKNCIKNNKCVNFQRKNYHRVAFVELYEKVTGESLSNHELNVLKKKHPTIDTLNSDCLLSTLQILEKFKITAFEACRNPHIFCMNPISMDNYGEILKECGFIKIVPENIIRYHTIVRSRTLNELKKAGLLEANIELEEKLIKCFKEWPESHKITNKFHDSTTILTIRTFILEKYLNWKIKASSEEFQKFCRNYLPLRHRPMCDIEEAINIAENEIGFSTELVKRNGFLISADPLNTKLIIGNVKYLAGLHINDAVKIEPAILKNNHNSILKIRSILEEYRISEEAQRLCLKVYCMRPETVKERLEELSKLKEYQVLKTNPRMLSMVIHKRKMLNRLTKMQAANKQCYSFDRLISSSKIFNSYIDNFGSKVCSRDIAMLISNSLRVNLDKQNSSKNNKSKEVTKLITNNLKRHKYWLNIALSVIHENITLLQKWFNDDVILTNCQILLYPDTEIQKHLDHLMAARSGKCTTNDHEQYYNNLQYTSLSDDQILSLILYEIEKKYHFTGDGVWSRLPLDSSKSELQAIS